MNAQDYGLKRRPFNKKCDYNWNNLQSWSMRFQAQKRENVAQLDTYTWLEIRLRSICIPKLRIGVWDPVWRFWKLPFPAKFCSTLFPKTLIKHRNWFCHLIVDYPTEETLHQHFTDEDEDEDDEEEDAKGEVEMCTYLSISTPSKMHQRKTQKTSLELKSPN